MSEISSPVLLFEKDGHVASLTLNRPHVLNAMNMAMRDELWSALLAVRDDPDVRVAVFRGSGAAFSAGADIREFGTAGSIVEARRARRERDLWGLMLSITKPLVAAIHGYALGAGCELSLLCDLRIAAEGARFGLPEVALGYIPSAGGTQTLPRVIPPGVAREMVLSGEPIGAARALAVKLVNRVVAPSELESTVTSLARRLAELPPAAAGAAKEAMLRGAQAPLAEGLRTEAMIAARLRMGAVAQ